MPPLRARPEDIEALAYHFAVNVTSELRRPFFPGFTERAMAKLKAHPWPGNVRELKNTVERSIYREEDPDQPIDALFFDPFSSPFAPSEGQPAAATLASGPQAASPADSQSPVAATPDPALELPIDFRQTVGEFEQRLLEAALEQAQFKQTAAAELLGLSYHQLRGLLKKYGLPK